MKHELKLSIKYFEDVKSNKKTFEIRKNTDRNFSVGDILYLREWNIYFKEYTGREIKRVITYIFEGGSFGVDKDYSILAIKPIEGEK